MQSTVSKRRQSAGRGTHVVWPKGLEEMLGISAPTRWRKERAGQLPARDVNIGGRTGWRAETVEAFLA